MDPHLYQNAVRPALVWDPVWVVAALALLTVVAMVVALPFRLFRLAWLNGFRADGCRSRKRTLKELKHLLDFTGELFLTPLLAAGAFGGVVALVHLYVVPIPMVADIFSVFEADPEAWEYAIEQGDLGDVGARYEAWSNEQGFSEQSARFWQEFLWEHWMALLFCAALLGLFWYWFVARYYVSVLVAYKAGILRRRKAYRKKDIVRMLRNGA